MAIWQKKLSPPFKRCNERVTIRESCDSNICCGVTPCTLCLVKVEAGGYGEEDIETKGSATLTDGTYEGTVDGHAFVGYWEKLYGVCEFVVELDGEEVGRWELCGYTEGVSCRNPAVTFDVPPAYGEEESTATISITVADPLELAPYEEVNQRCSLLDVCFVIDDTGSMGTAILEVIENASALVALAEAASVSAQFALISFKDDINTDLSFSVGNGAAFQTAVNLLTPDGGDNIPEASDYALQAAVNLPGWRQGGVNSRKVIVLITDAPPGGYDDVEDAEDLQRLIDAATAAKDAGIILAAVNAGNAAASLQAAVAANGPDGRYVSSVSSMIDRIEGLLAVECSQRPSCFKPFCGACNCTNRKLCLTVTGPDGCSIRQIIEYDGTYDTCDTVSQPKWPIDIECGYFTLSGDIALVRDEYTGDCVLLVPGRDEPVELTNCYPLEASWELANDDPYGDPYLFSVVGNDCGDCEAENTINVVGCPCLDIPFCFRYTVSTHSGTTNCDETGSICYLGVGSVSPNSWAAEDSAESLIALSVQCNTRIGFFACNNEIPGSGTGWYVTFKGQVAVPVNDPSVPTNGLCECEPVVFSVLFNNTICGGPGDGLIRIDFSA